MDASTILKVKPELTRFLHQFDGDFGRVTTRRYLDLYVEGQLSNLPRKSIEPMADAFGEPPRNLQEFLSLFRWDEQGVRDKLQQYVGRRHAHPQSVGVMDETSFVKKGDKTACVQCPMLPVPEMISHPESYRVARWSPCARHACLTSRGDPRI